MKFLIFFALAFTTGSTKDLHSRPIEVPVIEKEGRITNGKNADPGQFKYQVGISLKKGRIMNFCCGSLIDNNWILSAAHCTFGVSSAEVYLGATQRTAPEKTYSVPKHDIIVHPDFRPNIFKNDISLIRIPTTSESSRIGIIKISNNDDKHIGDSVVISGWGLISDTANGPTNNLQYGILKVSPESVCSEVYGSDFGNEASICVAISNGVSPCKGDSGGPLVLEKQSLQIGLLSYGSEISCAMESPLAFTRVGHYRLWINSLTKITY